MRTGSHRALLTPVEVDRQWYYPIGTPEGPAGEFATFAPRQCNLPTVTISIMVARLTNVGSTYYINIALLA